MLLAHTIDKKIEELVVEILSAGGQTGPSLLKALQGKEPGISKETFYRIVRKLLIEEVLNKHKTIYELNRHWLQKIYRFSKKQIEPTQSTHDILSFQEGDKMTYTFRNPNLMGIYWAHTYDMIFEQHDPRIPIFIFHPHEWLIHTRTESETFFLNRFQDDKKVGLFTIGGNTEIDKRFQKEWQNPYLRINTGIDYGLKNREYINVLGDFIFKVTVSRKFSNDIETFFKTHKEISEQATAELKKLCARNDIAKMILIRSKKEASKWQSKFKKDFHIPKY